MRDFGAKGDGVTDDTVAFQHALDSMGSAGGGTVVAPRGSYFFKGTLNVPAAVTLAGIWQSIPAHNGIRDAGLPKPGEDGTTFMVTAGRGDESSPPFVTLNTNSTLKGVVVWYPEQKPDETPVAYPYAVAMRGKNPAILDCELLNPYNAIDATLNERHLIRNIQGQPLRRGVIVDEIYDVGRLENVHFNPWWSMKPKVMQFEMEHGEAFIFMRSDWEYVFNTFCFGYNAGYHFVGKPNGGTNGNFLGIGADNCYTSVQVDECAFTALLITNGEFTAFKGPNPTMVRVSEKNRGTVRFVNCAFWGPCHQIAQVAGGTTGFSDCTFCQWDGNHKNTPAIQATGGSLIVRGCEFQLALPQVSLSEKVTRAVITGNIFTGKTQIDNQSKGSVMIADNAEGPGNR
ncbi:MAG TPA: glycosyl hydrolase family 28-related protein [Tepidisphaeraceae bacterium]|nr:glycosyl hydrolase family 28-related protein [Tepidisphaeraceae bacterium]